MESSPWELALAWLFRHGTAGTFPLYLAHPLLLTDGHVPLAIHCDAYLSHPLQIYQISPTKSGLKYLAELDLVWQAPAPFL